MTPARVMEISEYWAWRARQAIASADRAGLWVAFIAHSMLGAAFNRHPTPDAVQPDPVSVPVRVKEGRP